MSQQPTNFFSDSLSNAFLDVPSQFIILKSSLTIIDFVFSKGGNSRMAAPGGAFSAALRRSQDLDIGEQKHRHADRSARSLQAHRFFSSLHPTSNKLVHLENYFLARCRATVFVVYFCNENLGGSFLDVKPLLCLERVLFIWS